MKTKEEKLKLIKDLEKKFQETKGYLLVSLLNLSSEEQRKIKKSLKENNSLFQVSKKTLIYKANPNFPFSKENLKVPFAFIWSFDETFKALNVLKKLKKEGLALNILSGYIWKTVFNSDDIEKIINLPSREELIVKLISSLKDSLFRLNFAFRFPIKKLVFILSKIKNN